MNTRWIFLVLFFIPIYGMHSGVEEEYSEPIVLREMEQWIEWCDSIYRLQKLLGKQCSFERLWHGNVITSELINEIGNKIADDVQAGPLNDLLEDCDNLQEVFIKRCIYSSLKKSYSWNFNDELNYAIK